MRLAYYDKGLGGWSSNLEYDDVPDPFNGAINDFDDGEQDLPTNPPNRS